MDYRNYDYKGIWLEDRNKALENAAPKKKKRGIGGKIIIFLFIIALAGGAYYWFGMRPQQYAITKFLFDRSPMI